MGKALISVIIPVYNVQDYVRDCVESVLAQTYTELEILLVDDGSTDASGSICDEYASMDDRIRVIHRENGGLSAARNSGIKECRGEYVSFIDSDDAVSPVFIETLYNMCDRSGANTAICGIGIADDKDGTSMEELLSSGRADRSSVGEYKGYTSHGLLDHFYDTNMHHAIVVAWNKLYNREVIADIRYPEGFVYEDEATTFAFLYNAGELAWTDEKLYFYRNRSGSITKQGFSLKRLDVLEAYRRRRQFYIDHGEKKYAVREEYCQLSAYLDFYYLLGKKLPEEKKVRRELLDTFRALYKKYDKSVWTSKRRLLYAICFLCPSLYGVMNSVKKRG